MHGKSDWITSGAYITPGCNGEHDNANGRSSLACRAKAHLARAPTLNTLSDSGGLGWGSRICLSNKFPDVADARPCTILRIQGLAR